MDNSINNGQPARTQPENQQRKNKTLGLIFSAVSIGMMVFAYLFLFICSMSDWKRIPLVVAFIFSFVVAWALVIAARVISHNKMSLIVLIVFIGITVYVAAQTAIYYLYIFL